MGCCIGAVSRTARARLAGVLASIAETSPFGRPVPTHYMTSERMVRRPYHSSAWMRRQQRGVTQGFVGAAIRSLAVTNWQANQRAHQTQQMAFCVMRRVHDSIWESTGLVCNRVKHPRQCQWQIRTIGSLRAGRRQSGDPRCN
jgi:hypothetical protein